MIAGHESVFLTFFRVEHDLLRSEAFKTLGGSAIKVYLVIGLYSDFGTDWAYPSIRTIARQAGLSRQTVLNAIEAAERIWDFSSPTRRRDDRRLTESSAKLHNAPLVALPNLSNTPRSQTVSNTAKFWSIFFRCTASQSGLKTLDEASRGGPRIQTGTCPKSPSSLARAIGPNKNQHRKRTQHRSRFRERRFGSRLTDDFKLLLIYKNC